MKYFQNVKTLDELKKEYRKLVMKYHPDRGGSDEIMKAINAEHDELFEVLKKQHNARADSDHQTTETPEEFRNILDLLLRLDGLEIELCGCWLWISGDTRKHKDALKAYGCRWCSKKGLWSWHHVQDGSRHYRGKRSMAEIRERYGSQVIGADGTERSSYSKIGATA